MKVSIVVATYNGEKYLEEQLNSFVNQIIMPDEIVISDDNSTDSTIAGNILGGCCLAIKNHYLKEMFDFCPYTYHDNWLSYCMLALGDAVAINKSLFAYRLHGNNTVGCNNLLSNRKGIYKNFIKFKNRVKNWNKIYVD